MATYSTVTRPCTQQLVEDLKLDLCELVLSSALDCPVQLYRLYRQFGCLDRYIPEWGGCVLISDSISIQARSQCIWSTPFLTEHPSARRAALFCAIWSSVCSFFIALDQMAALVGRGPVVERHWANARSPQSGRTGQVLLQQLKAN